MIMKRNLWLLTIFMCMLPSVAWAQDESVEEDLDSTYTDINEHMAVFSGGIDATACPLQVPCGH